MIVNPPSVLAAFVSAVEVVLGALTVWLAARAALRPGGADERVPLLALLGATLAAISLAGLPLLYLTLTSYVPQWPGVMCVQGVTRVGEDSAGASRHLPALLASLAALRPLALLAAGSWLALRIVDRAARSAPLARRVAAAVAVAASLAALAGAAEIAYLLIPKEERFLATGCCVAPPDLGDRAAEARAALPGIPGAVLIAVHFGGGALLAAASAWIRVRARTSVPAGPAVAAALAGALYAAAALAFAGDVLCPAVLGLPHHRCAWCLGAFAPETLAAAALHLGSALAAGVAAVVAAAGRHAETEESARRVVATLSGLALFGYAGALVLAAMELVLAR